MVPPIKSISHPLPRPVPSFCADLGPPNKRGAGIPRWKCVYYTPYKLYYNFLEIDFKDYYGDILS